jgi:hypothetical protein
VQVRAQAASLTDAQRAVQAVQRQQQAAQAAHCRERSSWERAAARASREHAAQLRALEARSAALAQQARLSDQVPCPEPSCLASWHQGMRMLALLCHAFRDPDVCVCASACV